MGKKGKWIRSFLTGKKEKEREKSTTNHNSASAENPEISISQTPPAPKEKKRWSFGRSSAPSRDMNSSESTTVSQPVAEQASFDLENEEKEREKAVAAATAAVAAAAQAAAVVIRLTEAAKGRTSDIEETAAIKIQSVFRSYLARKALRALKGLVKLQALVRGHLVRKQATTTLRCMQALMTAQARARARRIRMKEDGRPGCHKQSIHRKSIQESRYTHPNYEIDRGMDENVKIVEMDLGQSKGNTKSRFSYLNNPETEHRISTQYASSKPGNIQASPAPSALIETSPKACSGNYEDYPFGTAQISPQHYDSTSKPDPFSFLRPHYAETFSYDYPLYPNYMANTKSSRAKVRSQSAPKQRPPDAFEKQASRRKPSMEGRIMPRGVKMQRSSSGTGHKYQHPWSIKLDRSTVSLIESECGSTSTVLTNTSYCRNLVGFDVHGNAN